MVSQPRQLRVLFIPYMSPGHMMPMVDIAKLFSLKGLKCTILTTNGNSSFMPNTHNIELHFLRFPSTNFPKGIENMSSTNSRKEQLEFLLSCRALRPTYEEALREIHPDVVVSDMFFSWTLEVAAELGIPRISFQGTNFFFLCTHAPIIQEKIQDLLANTDGDIVTLPDLPHRIELLRTQIMDMSKLPAEVQDFIHQLRYCHDKSFGTIVNSFYELEPDYVNYYKDVLGLKAWHVGPVSLCNKDLSVEATSGNIDSLKYQEDLKWLDSQPPRVVLYICFGSLCNLDNDQLKEISKGLEELGQRFIWVVRKDDDTLEWMTNGLKKMIYKEGKGFIIKGWAPQTFILNHIAIGGFMTHCGWNSCLESISYGVPMITWPLFADQFCNEKLIVELNKAGIVVGKPRLVLDEEELESMKAEEIKEVIQRLMGDGEEAENIRKKAKELQGMAFKAIEFGGSSYKSMDILINELIALSNNSSG